MRAVILYILAAILAMAFQLLLLENVQLLGYLNPYYYPILLVLWPLKWNRAVGLLVAFALGMTLDLFENSGGLHASACVLLVYLQPYLAKSLVARALEEGQSLTLLALGSSKFLTLTAMCMFVFHFWLFLLESFAFNEFFFVLFRTVLSTAVSTAMIYATQLLMVTRE
jgi:rod shape-determining protein MreD